MAIFHASTKTISRSAGRSSVAASAYRTGTQLTDSRTGIEHDYSRRNGIEYTEIITPDGQRNSIDRNQLWDAAEAAENRKDGRTAREWVVALPSELNSDQQRELVSEFGLHLAQRYNVAVDLAIHAPDKQGDQRNIHAHLLTTTREVAVKADFKRLEAVLGQKATLELSNSKRASMGLEKASSDIREIRATWAQITNRHLERAGIEERIDHRTLQAQQIDRTPTQHMGYIATEMERRGSPSDRGDQNRQIHSENAQKAQIQHELTGLHLDQGRNALADLQQAYKTHQQTLIKGFDRER